MSSDANGRDRAGAAERESRECGRHRLSIRMFIEAFAGVRSPRRRQHKPAVRAIEMERGVRLQKTLS